VKEAIMTHYHSRRELAEREREQAEQAQASLRDALKGMQ
jgi:hypothetical protein